MILITGASGFIGSNVSSLLKKNNISYVSIKRGDSKNSIQENDKFLYLKWPEDIKSLDLSKFSTVIYLAYAPVHQLMSPKELEYTNLFPIRLFVERIKESNPSCHLLFTSSQSAAVGARSQYGKIKLEAENIIRKSGISYTILKPGLVIGAGSRGLFSRICTFINRSPIVPLIGSSHDLIQPVSVSDIAEAIKKIIEHPELQSNNDYYLADRPIKFHEFLKKIAASYHLKRLFVPVPTKLIYLLLSIIERLWKNFPVTTTNLFGFLDLKIMLTGDSWDKLGMKPTAIEEALKKITEEEIVIKKSILPYSLQKEGRILFKILFMIEPSDQLMERYVEAHKFNDNEQSSNRSIEYMINRQLDIEAVELVLRSKKTILTKKLLMLIGLAETDPAFFGLMVNQKNCFLFSWVSLFYFFIRSCYKKFKGRIILWKYPQCMMQ